MFGLVGTDRVSRALRGFGRFWLVHLRLKFAG